jgi:hypothetical protein
LVKPAPNKGRLHPGADSIPGDRGHRAAEFDSADVYKAEETRKSMKYLTLIFLIIAAICIGGCASPNAISDTATTQTTLPTRTASLSTITPTLTRTPWPSPTPKPSPTPLPPPITPPAGIVFGGEKGNTLWVTQGDGANHLLFEGPEGSSAIPSHDLKKVTYSTYPQSDQSDHVPQEQFLVDLATSETNKIWPMPDKNLCPFVFVGSNSNIMVTLQMDPDADLGYACRGSPVIATLKGAVINSLKYLDKNSLIWGYPETSPDNKKLAFDAKGKPYIHFINGSTYPFQFNQYKFPELKDPYFFGPVWSPLGRYLAWDIGSGAEGDYKSGVAIFDFTEGSSSYSPDHELQLWEVGYGFITWSADEKYLAIINPEIDYFAIIDVAGNTISRDMNAGVYLVWSPVGHSYAIERYAESQNIQIESPNSPDIITIGSGKIVAWSPEGNALIFKIDDQYLLYDMQLKTSNPLLLPEGAHLIEWRDVKSTTVP